MKDLGIVAPRAKRNDTIEWTKEAPNEEGASDCSVTRPDSRRDAKAANSSRVV